MEIGSFCAILLRQRNKQTDKPTNSTENITTLGGDNKARKIKIGKSTTVWGDGDRSEAKLLLSDRILDPDVVFMLVEPIYH